MNATFKRQMSQVMTTAHRIMAATGYTRTWSDCLKNAWQVMKLQQAMRIKSVEFWYIKKSTGEMRQAFGTMIPSVIEPLINGRGERRGADLVTYFDIQKQEFRCFKTYNLVKVVC